MYKIFRYIFIFLLLNISTFSKEPTLSILRSVDSNGYQKFSIGMSEFICRPYGVITLEELFKRATLNSPCRKTIKKFFSKNPLDRYFSQNLLKNRQTYHVEFRKNRCVLYANSKESLSELLLKNGLAFKEAGFNDEEFNHSFTQAQDYAPRLKIGFYKERVEYECEQEINKE